MKKSFASICLAASMLMPVTVSAEKMRTPEQKKEHKKSVERIGGGAAGGAVIGALAGGGKGAAIGAAAGGGAGYLYNKHKKHEKEKEQR